METKNRLARLMQRLLFFLIITCPIFINASSSAMNKEKNKQLGDEREAAIILTQAWKQLKGSEKLCDVSVAKKVDRLPDDAKIHIATFLLRGQNAQKAFMQELTQDHRYIPAISRYPKYEIDRNGEIKLRYEVLWDFQRDYHIPRLPYLFGRFEGQLIDVDSIPPLKNRYITCFKGALKLPDGLVQDRKKFQSAQLFYVGHSKDSAEQTVDIRKYLSWVKKTTNYLKNFDTIVVDYGLVGYSDGTKEWVMHPLHRARLKTLSSEQLEECKKISTLVCDFNDPRTIGFGKGQRRGSNAEEFAFKYKLTRLLGADSTLPKIMRENLRYNYLVDDECLRRHERVHYICNLELGSRIVQVKSFLKLLFTDSTPICIYTSVANLLWR